MLNISEGNKTSLESLQRYKTVKNLSNRPHYKILNRIIWTVSIMAVIALFLPWTQNISGFWSRNHIETQSKTAIYSECDFWTN